MVAQPSEPVADMNGFDVDDIQISIANAVAMLPPSPPNTLNDFLASVVAGELVPAMCHSETRIDTPRYWENRRVQNSLRRLLEALQDSQLFGADDLAPPELGATAFDAILEWSQRNSHEHWLQSGHPLANSLDQRTFTKALAGLSSWPPEMSEEDKAEVFLALTVPTNVAVKNLFQSQSRPKELTKRMFCEGLARVPYNVPDFPVPTYLLSCPSRSSLEYSPQVVAEVAQNIAAIFSLDQTGLDHVKDFFLCGLLSLEEIQVALPSLVPQNLVDEAVMMIIRKSANFFTTREWNKLVTSVRLQPELNNEEGQVSARTREPDQPDLESPPPRPARESPLGPLTASPVPNVEPPGTWQDRGDVPEFWQPPADAIPVAVEVSTPGVPVAAPRAVVVVPDLGYDNADDASPTPPSGTGAGRPLAIGAQTQPLPFREIDKEMVVPLYHEAPASFQDFVVDWTSSAIAARGSSAPSGHQADEGAGTPQRSSGAEPAAPAAEAAGSYGARSTLSGDDPVAWISLEMQNECHGPYLARAFARCCQLYEARREPALRAGRTDA
jgi:hypothetical protein